ncbi:hypothetical protein WT57_24180 [Burkholderia pseudomultivorans]|uniref:Uncharacterized protein n=1 Tax=Burkholderia pseudomultivorans TaxID=1207504 RepID=A0A132EY68_9BURK|nr:hypothetical protein WT57_24180 [Burkholderia pseudomultivorans]
MISALASVSALAQGVKPSEMTSGPQIQRLQQQQLEAVKELNPSPNVLAPTGEKPVDTGIVNLPLDTPCFPIQAVGRASDSYAGVNEQAGIQAGDGGFDIKVGGNTDLKGAYIASTATQDKNQLTTGTLTFSDIQNRSEHEASSVGISAGGGVGNGGNSYATHGPQSGKNTGGALPLFVSESDSSSATTKTGDSEFGGQGSRLPGFVRKADAWCGGGCDGDCGQVRQSRRCPVCRYLARAGCLVRTRWRRLLGRR